MWGGLDTTKAIWEIDHVQPRAREGSDKFENKLLICLRCNGLRGKNRPDVIRRILFLGVLANRRAHGRPFPIGVSQVHFGNYAPASRLTC